MALLSVREAAARMRVSASTVYNLCQQRVLPHRRIGVGRGTLRIAEEDLVTFLEAKKVAGGQGLPPKLGAGSHDFTMLDGDRLREAWRRQGLLAGPSE